MGKHLACPTCGTTLREIVWGYGTLADVTEAGDVVIGGCVVDVDQVGRVAALQCPNCGTRTDEQGIALERPEPPATTEHPFAVAFSNPQPSRGVVTMTDEAQPGGGRADNGADASPFVDEDFGGIASGGDWRDQVEPYASREDELPPASSSAPERVDPYASREDLMPEHGNAWRDRVEPFAADGAANAAAGGAADTAADTDAAPGVGEPAGEAAPPGMPVDSHQRDTSDFTDAEEEGWPSRDDD